MNNSSSKPLKNQKTKLDPDKETESRHVSYKVSISGSSIMSVSTAERNPDEISCLSLKNRGLKTNGAYQLAQKIKVKKRKKHHFMSSLLILLYRKTH